MEEADRRMACSDAAKAVPRVWKGVMETQRGEKGQTQENGQGKTQQSGWLRNQWESGRETKGGGYTRPGKPPFQDLKPQ